MIRQVITCDVCGSQKQQTNHWFVAYEECGELRIGGWDSLRVLSPETKHLCGETCAHKLISHFLMRLVHVETQPATENAETAGATKTAVSSRADYAVPSPSAGQPGTHESPGTTNCARLKQLHPCIGRRTS